MSLVNPRTRRNFLTASGDLGAVTAITAAAGLGYVVLDGQRRVEPLPDAKEAQIVGTPAEVRAAIGADYGLNILDPDFGVKLGREESQSEKIKAAFDAYPGKSFFFPPGDYRLDSQLNVSSSNSLTLATGARIYAGARMETLINHDNGATHADGYAEYCSILGPGELDGNLLADAVLRVNAILRMPLGAGLTLIDGLHRGLLADSRGAELHCSDLRIKNTGTSNVDDNVGIECRMSDCQFSMVAMRDITVGVWDSGGLNMWSGIHPWLGTSSQLNARYAPSVAFRLSGNSILSHSYADTYRYGWRSSSMSASRIDNPTFFINPGNLQAELAIDNPGAVFDFEDDTGIVFANLGRYYGHPEAPHSFTSGPTTRFSARDSHGGNVVGVADYTRGVQQGTVSFRPIVFGSEVSGSHSYGYQVGQSEVRDGVVSHRFRIEVTIDSTIAGSLKIGGLPYPVGASYTEVGMGAIQYSAGVVRANLIGGEGLSGPLSASLIAVDDLTHSEVDASLMRGQTLQLWGQIECTFGFPQW